MRPLPVVFLPALLCDAGLWAPVLERLKDVVEPWVADLAGSEKLEILALRTLEKAPPRFGLAGVSMGGYVAFEILRQAPERVARLALFSTTACPDTEEQKARRRGLMEMALKGRFRGITPQLLPRLVHPDRLQDAALMETLTRMAERVGRDAFVRQQKAILGRPDSRPGLAAIRCPALVVAGDGDGITPPATVREIAEGIPGARFELLRGCGHMAPLEKPDETAALLRSWAEG